MTSIPVSALHERVPRRPSRAARRWRVFRRRTLPWVGTGLGFVAVLVFVISLCEVAPSLRAFSALGLVVSVLITAAAFTRVPGGWRAHVHDGWRLL
ncbi:hypothetical protein [uncultured Deinococcus sp.]|uniref:hypothetical protein n=1 Tax=uncultured Deinococcus sp. TaxID=158789 RepID=UPI0025E21C05|nr:hypothetical protein [uncultured Deinococcus sp.]